VLRHLRQGGVERAPGRGRQNHIVECPARHDRLDRAAAARAEQTREWDRRQASTVPPVPGCKQQDRAAGAAGFAPQAEFVNRRGLLGSSVVHASDLP
jgi:hypothetical protein